MADLSCTIAPLTFQSLYLSSKIVMVQKLALKLFFIKIWIEKK